MIKVTRSLELSFTTVLAMVQPQPKGHLLDKTQCQLNIMVVVRKEGSARPQRNALKCH